ncbi:hypothetical protein PIB30_049042 [Stylosanthes scabra]|uniref:C2 domain-containing protein n=1 Tax=Stylosanthes scabra TaxID=79078 RepID=A0ABU6UK23_9FABA|nr:hypothetical protein [Stylosanthes scabra]
MKLVVEVIDAHDLMPKDGEGSASPFVEVDYENQLSRTRTVPKNLNPTWNHKLLFQFDSTKPYHHQSIEVSIYHERRPVPGRSFLGRVRIPCSNLVKEGEEVYQTYPLEKKWFFSPVKGEIGLKLYIASHSKHKINPTTLISELEKLSPHTPLPQVAPQSNTTNLPPPTHFHTSPPSTTEDTVLVEETLEAEPKEGTTAFDTSEQVTEESGIVNTVPETNLIDPDPVSKQENREPVPERAQQLHRHQVHQQPMISIKRRQRGTPATTATMQTVNYPPQVQRNSHGHPSTLGNTPSIREHPSSLDHHGSLDDEDYNVKDTNLQLGERWFNGGRGWLSGGERFSSTYDLVEQMFYLYVRVVKAKDLPPSTLTSSCDPYVEVKLGNYKGRTKHIEKKLNPEWNQVFAFSKDRIQSSILEVFVKDKEMLGRDEFLGRVIFELNEVPTRVPPDSPLAPQWYRLEDRRGDGKVKDFDPQILHFHFTHALSRMVIFLTYLLIQEPLFGFRNSVVKALIPCDETTCSKRLS